MMGNSFKQEIFNPRPNSNVVVFCGETENINHTIHAALVKYNVDDLVFINPRSCFISPDLIDKNIANYKSNGSLASHNRDVDAEDFHINILPFWKFAQNLHMVLEDIVNINHGMGSISQLPKKIGFLDDMIFADYMVAELDRGADIKDLIEDLNAHQSQVNSK